MNILLWILQIAIALQSFAGGAYKIFKFEDIAKMPATGALPRVGWSMIGAFEMVCAVLLIVPAAMRWMPMLTVLAAALLALENLALAGLFSRYSRRLDAANPLVYVLAGFCMAAFVAYGRYSLRPL